MFLETKTMYCDLNEFDGTVLDAARRERSETFAAFSSKFLRAPSRFIKFSINDVRRYRQPIKS